MGREEGRIYRGRGREEMSVRGSLSVWIRCGYWYDVDLGCGWDAGGKDYHYHF